MGAIRNFFDRKKGLPETAEEKKAIPIGEILQWVKDQPQEDKIANRKMNEIATDLTSQMKEAFVISAKTAVPGFRVTENIQPVLADLCCYFLGIESRYDLGKGIYLTGDFGVGKSTLLKAYRQWLADWFPFRGNGFTITSVEEIVEHYKKHGSLDKYVNDTIESGFNNPRHLLINEFGKPIKEKIYGTEAAQIINSLMMMRYDLFQNNKKVTHITSNFMPSSEEKALVDRYVEMFNVIPIKGQSFRR